MSGGAGRGMEPHVVSRDEVVQELDAGVSVLYDYADRQPQLVIRTGSVIARVLTIAGLDEYLVVQTA